MLAVPSVAGIWYFGTGHEMSGRGSQIFMVSLCGAFALLGSYLVVWVWKTRVVLRDDAIELHGLLLSRLLREDDITGWKTVPRPNMPPSVSLMPRAGCGRKLELTQAIRFDDAFRHWLQQFADLDAEDKAASEKEVLENAEIGATTEDRNRVLRGARRTARIFMVATFAAAAWGWLYPQPYRAVIAVLAIIPILALLLAFRSGGLYRLDAKRNDAHPNLAIPFIFPGFVLAIRAVTDFHFIGWSRPGLVAVAIGVAVVVVAALCDPSLLAKTGVVRAGALAALLFSTTAFGFGAGLEANALFDRSRPQLFSAAVVSKRISHGKRTEYQLVLPPWGPLRERSTVTVPRRTYDSVGSGTRVCIELYGGALRVPWYLLDVCPTSAE